MMNRSNQEVRHEVRLTHRPVRAATAALYAGTTLMLVPYVASQASAPVLTGWGQWLVFLYGAALVCGGIGSLVLPVRGTKIPAQEGNDVP